MRFLWRTGLSAAAWFQSKGEDEGACVTVLALPHEEEPDQAHLD